MGFHIPSRIDSASFPPVKVSPGTEDSGGGFCDTGHGPLRPLIVSNLKWGEPCRGHYVFPAGRYQIFHNSLKRRMEGISYFPYTVALRGRNKVRPRT